MWNRRALLGLAVCLAACGGGDQPPPADQTPPATPAPLFERLGGATAVTAVVDTFIAKAAADTRINAKFGRSDIPRLRYYLIQQVCAVTGGGCQYTGRDLGAAHQNMGVTDGEFDALVEDLTATLTQFNVPEAEKNELLGILSPLRGAIVTVPGSATGTPLPANFQPAPALPAETLQAGPIRR